MVDSSRAVGVGIEPDAGDLDEDVGPGRGRGGRDGRAEVAGSQDAAVVDLKREHSTVEIKAQKTNIFNG